MTAIQMNVAFETQMMDLLSDLWEELSTANMLGHEQAARDMSAIIARLERASRHGGIADQFLAVNEARFALLKLRGKWNLSPEDEIEVDHELSKDVER